RRESAGWLPFIPKWREVVKSWEGMTRAGPSRLLPPFPIVGLEPVALLGALEVALGVCARDDVRGRPFLLRDQAIQLLAVGVLIPHDLRRGRIARVDLCEHPHRCLAD